MRPLGIGEKRQGQTEDGKDEKQANQRAKVEKKKQGDKKDCKVEKKGCPSILGCNIGVGNGKENGNYYSIFVSPCWKEEVRTAFAPAHRRGRRQPGYPGCLRCLALGLRVQGAQQRQDA